MYSAQYYIVFVCMGGAKPHPYKFGFLYFSLSFNKIGDEGAEAVVTAMQTLPNLEKFE